MPNKYQEIPKARLREDKPPFPLADLPPEIRILIFEEYVRWINRDIKVWKKFSREKASNIPDLIKALRPNSTLYSEALDVYYNLSTLSISKNNEKRVKYMPRRVAERARSLELWYGYVHILPITPPVRSHMVQSQDEGSRLGVRTRPLFPHKSSLEICQCPPSLYYYNGGEICDPENTRHSDHAKHG